MQPMLLSSGMLLGADLRCHCLNFHGRVKEASVKNFQLVRLWCHNLSLLAMPSPAAAPAVSAAS
jgi:Tub family